MTHLKTFVESKIEETTLAFQIVHAQICHELSQP